VPSSKRPRLTSSIADLAMRQSENAQDLRLGELLRLISSAHESKQHDWLVHLEQDLVECMNKYFFVTTRSQPRYFEEVSQPADAKSGSTTAPTTIVERNRTELMAAYEGWQVPSHWLTSGDRKADKRKKLLDVWLSHHNRREYHNVVFDPRPAAIVAAAAASGSKDYNVFKNLAITKDHAFECFRQQAESKAAAVAATAAAQEQARPLLDHIRHIWCRGDQAAYDYVLDWMALLVQQPDVPPRVAIVIQGEQGAGKGVVIQKLAEIVGQQYFKHAKTSGDVTQRFTADLEYKLLLFVDEADLSRQSQAMQRVKTLITEATHRIEAKFKSLREAANFLHLIFASNQEHPLDVSRAERRLCILKADSKHCGRETPESKSYHDRVRHVPAIALAHVLYQRDITQFQPRQFPVTEALREQKQLSMSSSASWWQRCLGHGSVDATTRDWPPECPKADLFTFYIAYCKNAKLAPVDVGRFWISMYEVIGGKPAREHRPGGGQRVVRIPPLDECRAIMCRLQHDPHLFADVEAEERAVAALSSSDADVDTRLLE
jgi:hypothetical protein